jgi:hypothetical protein
MKAICMETTLNEAMLSDLLQELRTLRNLLEEKEDLLVNANWVPWSRLAKFLDYGDTQMSYLESSHNLVVAKVGRRKFVHRDSIERMLVASSQEK